MKLNTILINRISIREKLILFLFKNSKNVYRKYFKKNKRAWNISMEELSYFNNGTLGKTLSIFLNENNFKLEPKLESHDVYHILTNYPTTVIGEICLSSFNIGTGKKSSYTLLVALIGALIMVEHFNEFKEAYYKGKQAKNYTKWDFEHLLKEETEVLKDLLFNKKIEKEIII